MDFEAGLDLSRCLAKLAIWPAIVKGGRPAILCYK